MSNESNPAGSESSIRTPQTRAHRALRRGLRFALLAALAGGTVPSVCQTRFKELTVQATTDFVLNTLLDPAVITQVVFGTSETTEE